MLNRFAVFACASLISIAAYSAGNFDGMPFGSDGYPVDCGNPVYKKAQFSGFGEVMCRGSKELNVAFSAMVSTGIVASTVEIANRCGFEYTDIGRRGVAEIKRKFPKTWRLYMQRIGGQVGMSCSMARTTFPLIFK